MAMQLESYLIDHDIPHAMFADWLGVKRQTVYRWCSGENFPQPEMLLKIQKLTKGEVTSSDFLVAAIKYRVKTGRY